jgi:acetyl esterase/lipase
LQPLIRKLKVPAELFEVAGGDHSFKVLKRVGVTQEDAYQAVLNRIDQWLRATITI